MNDHFIMDKAFLPVDLLGVVLDHVDQGIVLVGPKYRTLVFNQHFVTMLQLPVGIISVGSDFRDVMRTVALATRQDKSSLNQEIAQLGNETPFSYEFVRTIDGVVRCFSLLHRPISGKCFVRTITEITTQKILEANQLKSAMSDPVTGLFNRKSMVALVRGEMKRVKRHQRSFSILMVDVDHFKKIVDQFGQAAGDELLTLFATECSASMMRENDSLGRWGDSEFMLILLETDQVNAMLVAKRMRKKMGELKVVTEDGQPIVPVTVSIGVTTITVENADHDAEAIIERVNQAMFMAKGMDRNHVVYS